MAARWQAQRDLATRNEQEILAAARRLYAHSAGQPVEVRDIAKEAGVGVGTVYRRFGDRAALLAAVTGGEERRLQERILRGKPPIGPGAAAESRLDAFLVALAGMTERNLDVLLATDSVQPGWIGTGAYAAWRLHVQQLLGEPRADLGPSDRGWYADVLLAPLAPQAYAQQRRERGVSARRLLTNLRSLAATVVSAS